MTVGAGVVGAVHRHMSKRSSVPAKPRESLNGLKREHLDRRFAELVPEFRSTRAGAGIPAGVGDEELATYCSLGLVECVKMPHVAAGYLDVYRLTTNGEKTYRHLVPRGRGKTTRS